ncbi:MAG TPA: alpha/beta hydrolase, partial [Alteromonas sp.]|nr:alpha/beta hydrolase [Alteromonas sp.]
MKVIFSHGKESGPWGTKIRVLANIAEEMGCQIQ